jgi:hypothetical protein
MRYLLIIFALLFVGCTAKYYKCRDCNAAYKATGGFLGQFGDKGHCRNCGGEAFRTTKKNSGWDEERYQRNGDELPY